MGMGRVTLVDCLVRTVRFVAREQRRNRRRNDLEVSQHDEGAKIPSAWEQTSVEEVEDGPSLEVEDQLTEWVLRRSVR